jgi:glycosyltransferase involved in cell wall biosynthesis
VNDIRWFAPNRYSTLVVDELQGRGLSIATAGTAGARLALSMSGTTALEAWRFARRSGCPLVLYLWDLPPKSTGSGTFDPVVPMGRHLIRVPRLRGGFRRRRGYYSRLRYIAARAQEVWVPSRLTHELVRSRFGVEALHLPYCYDSARFTAASTSRDVPPTLLTVGRLQSHKNHAATLRAAIRQSCEVQVRLIGRGPELQRLQQLAKSLTVTCRIETQLDDVGVADAYRRARVVVCPSRFEGFGLTPVEAIASATPVTASDIPPHREFVGTAARLFPVDDESALSENIAQALEDPRPDPATVADLTIQAAADRFLIRLQTLLH